MTPEIKEMKTELKRLLQRIRIYLALIRKFGIREVLTAHRESSNTAYIMTDCPDCGHEFRVHKMRVRHDGVKCPICGTHLILLKQEDKKSPLQEIWRKLWRKS